MQTVYKKLSRLHLDKAKNIFSRFFDFGTRYCVSGSFVLHLNFH